MMTIVFLNVVFAVLVAGGILALLGWAIVKDKATVAALSSRSRGRVRSSAPRRPVRSRGFGLSA
jgi:hypothetical protein